MLAPACLIYETHGRQFEAALKREFASTQVNARPCQRSLDLVEHLQSRPGSVVVIDWQSVTDALQVVGQIAELRLASGILVLIPLRCEAEWPLRDLGASSVLSNTTQVAQIARQCHQWLGTDNL